jgi:multimeric flavodoxin WrbA
MGRNILVLTGSPRRKGNSNAMAQAFISACGAKGHAVQRLDAPYLKLTGCMACETCFSKGKPCTLADDDFNALVAPAVEKADVIVFAMPVYWYSVPSQIKMAIDKLFAFMVGGRDISGKQYGLIACCEEQDDEVFSGLRYCLRKTAELVKWTSIGEVCVPGVNKAGDIEGTDGCARAAALADAL